MALFDFAAKYIVRELEDYWTENPKDKGELTIWGVASASFPEHVKAMAKMTKEKSYEYALENVYHPIWKQAKCDEWSPGVAVLVFDMAIQHGVKNNVKNINRDKLFKVDRGALDLLQQAARAYPFDGIVGPITKGTVKNWDQLQLIHELVAVRNVYYAYLESFPDFDHGWMRRSALMHGLCQNIYWQSQFIDAR